MEITSRVGKLNACTPHHHHLPTVVCFLQVHNFNTPAIILESPQHAQLISVPNHTASLCDCELHPQLVTFSARNFWKLHLEWMNSHWEQTTTHPPHTQLIHSRKPRNHPPVIAAEPVQQQIRTHRERPPLFFPHPKFHSSHTNFPLCPSPTTNTTGTTRISSSISHHHIQTGTEPSSADQSRATMSHEPTHEAEHAKVIHSPGPLSDPEGVGHPNDHPHHVVL
ncbi:hypothetical protein Pelo_383 [Pelomyxa schiedti]|nr:hypothetical protein Pelo_383 [Pelomyxa schiedti]